MVKETTEAEVLFNELTAPFNGFSAYNGGDATVKLGMVKNPKEGYEGSHVILVETQEETRCQGVSSQLYILLRGVAREKACLEMPEGQGVGSSDVNCYLNEVCYDFFYLRGVSHGK